MAEKQARKLKQTVREKTGEKKPQKKRVLKKTATTAKKPLGVAKKGISSIFRPFKFLLAPFRTKPIRTVGRWLSKLLLIDYFRNSWKELKQVTWPNRKQTTQLTLAVFAFAFAFAAFITAIDYGLDKLFKHVLLK